MASSLSVKDRMKMFEVGSSPRSRLSPRQRLARLSPRSRFNRKGGAVKLAEVEEQPIPDSDASHPFNDTLSRKKSVTLQETDKDIKATKKAPSITRVSVNGFSMPPKSPRPRLNPPQIKSWSQVNYDENIMSISTSDNTHQEEGYHNRAPRSKSPRQPKSPNNFSKSSKPNKILQDENDFHDGQPKKPEWQLKRVKIMGNKEYESPLSRRKRNMHEAVPEQNMVLAKQEANNVVLWPEDDEDEDIEDREELEEYRDELPEGFPWEDENQAPARGRSPRSGGRPKIPSLQPSGRDSPRSSSRRRTARSPSPDHPPTHCMGYDLDKVIGSMRCSPTSDAPGSSSMIHSESESTPENTILLDSAFNNGNDSGNNIAEGKKLVTSIIVDTDDEGKLTLSPRKKVQLDQDNASKSRVEANLKQLEAMVAVMEGAASEENVKRKEKQERRQESQDSKMESMIDDLDNIKADAYISPDNSEDEEKISDHEEDTFSIPSVSTTSDNPEDDTAAESKIPVSETKSFASSSHSDGRLSRVERLRNMKAQSPAMQRYTKSRGSTPSPEITKYTVGAGTLKRTLDSASIVIQDEKESSVGSGGSDRSHLSTEELGSIASRALSMSRVLSHTKHSKLKNTPIHHLLKQRAKRGRFSPTPASSEGTGGEIEHKNETTKYASGEDYNETNIPVKSAKEPHPQFPLVSRSYRNTRLARRYLHRTTSADETSSITSNSSSFPKHAVRSSPTQSNPVPSSSKEFMSSDYSSEEKSASTGDKLEVKDTKSMGLPPAHHGSHQGQSRPGNGFSLLAGAHAGIQFCGNMGLGQVYTEETFTLAQSTTDLTDMSASTRPPKNISVFSPSQSKLTTERDVPETSKEAGSSNTYLKGDFSDTRKLARANALVALYKHADGDLGAQSSRENKTDTKDILKQTQKESSDTAKPRNNQSQKVNDSQTATDIFSRSIARRRQHPALAKKANARRTLKSATKVAATKQAEMNSNSIFADKKEIALTYWRYSKSIEGDGKSPMGQSQDNQFVTKREENMHESHELDTGTNELYNNDLTSDLTLSMPTGSSGDQSGKELGGSSSSESTQESGLQFEASLTNKTTVDNESEAPSKPSTGKYEFPASSKVENAAMIAYPNLCYKQDCVAISAEEGCACDTMQTTEQELLLFAESLRSNTNQWRTDVRQNFSAGSEPVMLNPYTGNEDDQRELKLKEKEMISDIDARLEKINAGPSESTQPIETNVTSNSMQADKAQAEGCLDGNAFKRYHKDTEKNRVPSEEPNQAPKKVNDLKKPVDQQGESQDDDRSQEPAIFKEIGGKYMSSPPPPPPLQTNNGPTGTLVDEQCALKTVSSDITTSILAGENTSFSQVDERDALQTVQSDISISLLAGEGVIPHFHHVEDPNENGIGVSLASSLAEGFEKLSVEGGEEDIESSNSEMQRMKTEANEKTESAIGSHIMIDSSAIMKLGFSFVENFYSGMCNVHGIPNEKIVGLANKEDPADDKSQKEVSDEVQIEKSETSDVVSSKYSTEFEGVGDAVLADSETGSTLFSENEDAVKAAALDDQETRSEMLTDSKEDELLKNGTSLDDEESRFIPDIDDYSKDTDDLESEISLKLLEEVITHPVSKVEQTQKLSPENLDMLTTFASICKTQGIEVLKLNRRNKWQLRYLTASEESVVLDGDLTEYPKALLWVKRFQANHSYSTSLISSEGKGGVEFANISSTTVAESSETIPPKGFPKFKHSVQLNVNYSCGGNPRSLAMRFKTQGDADVFISSIAAVKEVLKE